jgi:hypothetical protein
MKIAVFWVVAPCSLVEVYQRFRGPCGAFLLNFHFTHSIYDKSVRYNLKVTVDAT